MKKIINRIGTMNLILIIIATMLVAFTATMIVLFIKYQEIPDTLCTCFYTACGGECGFMGLIKSAKVKYGNKDDDSDEAEVAEEDDSGEEPKG